MTSHGKIGRWSLWCLLAVAGCAVKPAQPVHWLVLSPLAPVTEHTVPAARRDTAVLVGPIDLPAYTDRAQLLVLRNQSEMQTMPAVRWAEPLGQNFSRVLVENLSRLLATGQVTTLGGIQTPGSVQLAIEVTEFVTTVEGEARLTAYWRVLGAGGREVHAADKTHYVEALEGSDGPARASALSRALAALSRDLAEAVRSSTP